ncbi:MAG: hypothetical protein H0W99_00570 [Acidobacteria bacterium]|nr:hypothetical protein [Acidobacteriota bacterium]
MGYSDHLKKPEASIINMAFEMVSPVAAADFTHVQQHWRCNPLIYAEQEWILTHPARGARRERIMSFKTGAQRNGDHEAFKASLVAVP